MVGRQSQVMMVTAKVNIAVRAVMAATVVPV
jgi:hypothetical protein